MTYALGKVIAELPSANLTLATFTEFMQKHQTTKFSRLNDLYLLPYIDLSFAPACYPQERDCILYLLEGSLNVDVRTRVIQNEKEYLKRHMQEGAKFYMIPREFWNAWSLYAGPLNRLGGKLSVTQFIEKKHTKKVQSWVEYPASVVFVPYR